MYVAQFVDFKRTGKVGGSWLGGWNGGCNVQCSMQCLMHGQDAN